MKIFHTRKQMLAFFMPGFILGIAYINFFARRYVAGEGIFERQILEQYVKASFDVREYLFYVLRMRLIPFLLLALTIFMSIRKIVAYAFLLWTGFTSGMILSTAALELGAQGCLFCIVGVFPQMFFYVSAYIVILWYSMMYPHNRWNRQKTGFVIAMMAAGILSEALLNPILVKMFLRAGLQL